LHCRFDIGDVEPLVATDHFEFVESQVMYGAGTTAAPHAVL
jgi:hypothetical protein